MPRTAMITVEMLAVSTDTASAEPSPGAARALAGVPATRIA
jgi:hypothetical protein